MLNEMYGIVLVRIYSAVANTGLNSVVAGLRPSVAGDRCVCIKHALYYFLWARPYAWADSNSQMQLNRAMPTNILFSREVCVTNDNLSNCIVCRRLFDARS